MSNLFIVRKALETNPDVIIVKINKLYERSSDKPIHWFQSSFMVAPKNGLYTANELQTFMKGLVPDLKPTEIMNFYQFSEHSDLKFGAVYFDEVIGKVQTITKEIIKTDDKELLEFMKLNNNTRTIETDVTEEYKRRIWIRPFPNEKFARDVVNKTIPCEFSVGPEYLKKYL